MWSSAGHVMTNARSGMSPIVFEAIMYLKYNVRLWSLQDVVEANKRRKKKLRGERREKAQQKSAEIAEWDNANTNDVEDDGEESV